MTKSIFTTFILLVTMNCIAAEGEPYKQQSTQETAAAAKAYAKANLIPMSMDSEENIEETPLNENSIQEMNAMAAKAKAFVTINLTPLEMDADE